MYDGKVLFNDLSRPVSVSEKDGISLYTAVVNSLSLKRNIRIVYLVRRQKDKVATALLFSTDTDLSATLSDRISVPGCQAVYRTFGLSGSLRNKP